MFQIKWILKYSISQQWLKASNNYKKTNWNQIFCTEAHELSAMFWSLQSFKKLDSIIVSPFSLPIPLLADLIFPVN